MSPRRSRAGYTIVELMMAITVLAIGVAGALALTRMLTAWLGLHAAFTLAEGRLAPVGREKEFARAHALVAEGPYASRHWRIGVALGMVVPFLILAFPAPPLLGMVAAALVLVGLWSEEDVLVRAGQAPSIS